MLKIIANIIASVLALVPLLLALYVIISMMRGKKHIPYEYYPHNRAERRAIKYNHNRNHVPIRPWDNRHSRW